MTSQSVTLQDIRECLMENCMLTIPLESIQEDTLLFGPNSLGLDSIDALQISLAIETKFKTPIKDPELARQILATPGSIKDWVNKQKSS